MKIYTKTGDRGETMLFGGARVSKDHARIEAFGTVDELNAALGVARAAGLPTRIDALIGTIQHQLFALGAELAQAGSQSSISPSHIAALEKGIDDHEAQLAPLKHFILPSGAMATVSLHVARAVCRRAERRVVTLSTQEDVSANVLIYLNRLSDLLFVLARATNAAVGQPEVLWDSQT